MDADVIVVGAGNAGCRAALAARERGASVLVLEKAPPEWAGGNSAFTAGAMRLEHGGLQDLLRPREDDERHAVTDLAPYTRTFAGRPGARDFGARRSRDGARAGRRLRATRCAG